MLEDILEFPEEHENDKSSRNKNNPSRAYVRDAEAIDRTPADVAEYPNSYVIIVDMPGIKGSEIKVQIENDTVLVVSGERKRDRHHHQQQQHQQDGKSSSEDGGVKCLRMERRVGMFLRKFPLPVEAISAVCQDGVLTVTVEKLPPPEPKKPRTIQAQVA